jgi:hypothetical protein
MIIDTTYLLPLIGIAIDTDLLKAIVEKRTRMSIGLDELRINSISLFELQAVGAKKGVNYSRTVQAVPLFPLLKHLLHNI